MAQILLKRIIIEQNETRTVPELLLLLAHRVGIKILYYIVFGKEHQLLYKGC